MVGESARSLFADAQAMLDRIIAEHWLTPRGAVGLWRCRREGDDILVLAGNDETRLPMLRQQVKKREGRANMCLADFIDPAGEDWIGGFAVGDPRHRAASRPLQGGERRLFGHPAEGAGRPSCRGLRRDACTPMSATAIWGYAPDEHLTNAELIRENYAASARRPAIPPAPTTA